MKRTTLDHFRFACVTIATASILLNLLVILSTDGHRVLKSNADMADAWRQTNAKTIRVFFSNTCEQCGRYIAKQSYVVPIYLIDNVAHNSPYASFDY